MLRVEVPKDTGLIVRQIKALEKVIKTDTREEDIKNHKMALKAFKNGLYKIEERKVIELAQKFKKNDIENNCVLLEDEIKDIECYFKCSPLYNEVKCNHEGDLEIDIFTFEKLFVNSYLR